MLELCPSRSVLRGDYGADHMNAYTGLHRGNSSDICYSVFSCSVLFFSTLDVTVCQQCTVSGCHSLHKYRLITDVADF